MLIWLSVILLLCCLFDFFSFRVNSYASRAFEKKLSDSMRKIHTIINWALCGIVLTITVFDYLLEKNLELLGGILFISILVINAIYSTTLVLMSANRIKNMSVECMREFILIYKDKKFENDSDFIHQFCREYYNFDEKETKTALKKLERERKKKN